MDFNNEIEKIMLECKNKGLNSWEVLQLMEVPYECTEDSYLFDFDSIHVEELSDYIDYIFRKRWYVLEEGTPVDGFYGRFNYHIPGSYSSDYDDIHYRYKVEIYSSGGKTYLEMFMPHEEFEGTYLEKQQRIKFTELEQIVYQIKFLKPSIKGYLVCNKCGAYYEVHKEESHEWFPDKCECGGIFKHITCPKQPEKKLVKRKKTASPTEYLRAPAAMIIVTLSCFVGGDLYYPYMLNYVGVGFLFGTSFALMRYRSHELVLDMIYLRLIYFSAAIIFFVASWGLIILIQINNYSTTMIGFFIVAVMAVIYGIGMIFRTISPDDPRNFLDPPLWK